MTLDQLVDKSQTETIEQEDKAKAKLAPLITADELKELIEADSPNVKILEPGLDFADFSKAHLPRAQFLHWVNDMTDPEHVERYNIPKKEQFTQLMSRLGIHNDDRIVIYDRLHSRLSTRLFWTLKYFDHQQVQVLDGGFAAWESKSFLLSKDNLEIVESEYVVSTTHSELLADMEFVESQRKDSNTVLIDGRPGEQYSGNEPGRVFHTGEAHPRKGHIPGAVNIFWADNFNEDGTFKSAAELRSLYANANVKPGNDVITYCNEGLHASPPWFVLTQLLDYKNVRLYDSSMAEWAASEHPLKTDETADAKPKANADQ